MNSELLNLIELAIADGTITDKERAVILRKASALGEDPDEVEMVLDGKLAASRQGIEATKQGLEQRAYAEILKCPSCNASVGSFLTRCPDCGSELRQVQASSTIKKLYEELQRIEEQERSRPRSWVEKLDGELAVARSVATRQALAISSFPVPTRREDILEFLALASAESVKKISWMMKNANHPEYQLKKAWTAKLQQIVIKARLSMKDDKKTLEEIEYYAKELNIK